MISLTMFLGVVCLLSAPLVTPHRTKLIYHHSVASPFYNATASVEEKWERERVTSKARIEHLTSIEATISIRPDQDPLFFVELTIGGHELVQRLAFDTGSSLTWVKCSGGESNYDPAESSTYRLLRCTTELFCKLHEGKCEVGVCTFLAQYKTGQRTTGALAFDNFHFSTTRAKSEIKDVVFGCADFTTLNLGNGVFGLGSKDSSIMVQKDYSKFSYCLGNMSDPHYEDHVLTLEEDSRFQSPKAKLSIDRYGHYNVLLEQISVGGKSLDIVFPIDITSTAILDTGASFSLLIESAYLELEKAIKEIIGTSLIKFYRDDDKLCYLGSVHDLAWFPPVQFYLKPQVIMDLRYENIFQQHEENVVCLGIENAADYGRQSSLIGANLQQYFYMAYNLKTMLVGVERMECNRLWD